MATSTYAALRSGKDSGSCSSGKKDVNVESRKSKYSIGVLRSSEMRQNSVLLPLAILISTLKDPSATTGGRLVTEYKDRKFAAGIKSVASYSHWTWRLKSPNKWALFVTTDK